MKKLTWCLTAVLPLIISAAGCGAPDKDEASDDLGSVDGQYPYPNIRGGDVKGDKNFSDLINKYAQGKGDKGWAAFWWPYTGNGIASSSYGGTGPSAGAYSPAGKYRCRARRPYTGPTMGSQKPRRGCPQSPRLVGSL